VTCTSGTLPRNAGYPADIIIVTALLGEAATITLDVGSNHVEFQAGAGSIPFPPEDSQIAYLQINRNNQTVKSRYGTDPINISIACSHYNFIPWVGVLQ
jgi:glucan endo-1,3-alpha-glucosidase